MTKKLLLTSLAIFLSLVLTGCETDSKPAEPVSSEIITSKIVCEEQEGKWEIIGDSPSATAKCNLPTADAGKECTDSSQCESYCQAPSQTEIDATIAGQCYEFQTAICMQEVLEGKASAEWCY